MFAMYCISGVLQEPVNVITLHLKAWLIICFICTDIKENKPQRVIYKSALCHLLFCTKSLLKHYLWSETIIMDSVNVEFM